MSISAISSCSSNTAIQTSYGQRRNEFKQLTEALQSGDLGAAQKAYSTLTPAASRSSSTSNQDKPLAQDFQALGKALQSGDLSGAQSAFAKLQKDAKAEARSPSTSTTSSSGAYRSQRAQGGDGDFDGGRSPSYASMNAAASGATGSSGAPLGTMINLLA